MIQKLKSIFKAARLISSDDSGDLRKGIFSYQGKQIKGTLFTPYGLLHNPPNSSLVITWSQNGQESNEIGIADDVKNRTLKSLQKGEVAVTNYLTGAYVLFKSDGNIDVVSPSDVNVTCVNANVTASNDVTVSASNDVSVTASNDVTISAVNANVTASSGASFTIGSMSASIDSSGITVTNGDIVADGISLKTHVHTGVTTGGSNTGGPV